MACNELGKTYALGNAMLAENRCSIEDGHNHEARGCRHMHMREICGDLYLKGQIIGTSVKELCARAK